MTQATNSQILHEINILSELTRETNESVIRLEEQMKPMCKDIDRLKKTIYGENGDHIGLSESLRTQGKKLDSLITNNQNVEVELGKEKIMTKSEYTKFKFGLIAGIVLLVLNFLSDIAKHFLGG